MILAHLTPREIFGLKGIDPGLDNIFQDKIFWRDKLRDYHPIEVASLCYAGIVPCPDDDYWRRALDIELGKRNCIDIEGQILTEDGEPNYSCFKGDDIYERLGPYRKYLYYTSQIVCVIEVSYDRRGHEDQYKYHIISPYGHYILIENNEVAIIEHLYTSGFDSSLLHYDRDRIENLLKTPRFFLYKGIESIIAENVTYDPYEDAIRYMVTGLSANNAIKFLERIEFPKNIDKIAILKDMIKGLHDIIDDIINA